MSDPIDIWWERLFEDNPSHDNWSDISNMHCNFYRWKAIVIANEEALKMMDSMVEMYECLVTGLQLKYRKH